MDVIGSHVESVTSRRRMAAQDLYGRATSEVIVFHVEPWTSEAIEARRLVLAVENESDKRYRRMELLGGSVAKTSSQDFSFVPSQAAVVELLAEYVGKGAIALNRGSEWVSLDASDRSGFKVAQKLQRDMNRAGYRVAASSKLSNVNRAVVEIVRLPSADVAEVQHVGAESTD